MEISIGYFKGLECLLFSVKVFKVKILNSYGRVFLCSLLFIRCATRFFVVVDKTTRLNELSFFFSFLRQIDIVNAKF